MYTVVVVVVSVFLFILLYDPSGVGSCFPPHFQFPPTKSNDIGGAQHPNPGLFDFIPAGWNVMGRPKGFWRKRTRGGGGRRNLAQYKRFLLLVSFVYLSVIVQRSEGNEKSGITWPGEWDVVIKRSGGLGDQSVDHVSSIRECIDIRFSRSNVNGEPEEQVSQAVRSRNFVHLSLSLGLKHCRVKRDNTLVTGKRSGCYKYWLGVRYSARRAEGKGG